MSLVTNWGYTLTADDADLDDLLTDAEFDALTASKYDGDARIAPTITAASMAIRNYCGWHIYPSASCSLTERLLYGNGRVKLVGRDLMIQLPTRYLTAVSSVVIDDTTLDSDDIDFDQDGMIYVFDVAWPLINRKAQVTVTYMAGVPDDLMSAIKEIAAHRVSHALASSYGVTSEAAGGVSITYNANWVNSARATALPDDDKEVLAPYKTQGVF